MFELSEAEIANLNSLQNNDGFRVLLKLLNAQSEESSNIRSCETLEALFFRKGQLDVLDTVNNLDAIVDVLSEQLSESNADLN